MGQLVFQATLGGQVNLIGPNTASTFNINVPATSGNMVTTGDTGTVTTTMLASTTGSGAVVLATSPTLVTPALGTPSALVGTNITGTAAGLSIGGNAATATTATNVSGGTSSVTSETVSGNLTLSGGTANGVAYLNGSKVITTGSALTFDGTILGVGSGSTAGYGVLQVRGGFAYVNEDGANTHQLYMRSLYGSAGPAIQVGGADPLLFVLNSAEQMRLTSTGLGIGTSSPNRKLEVGGTTSAYMGFNSTSNRRYTIGSEASGFVIYDDTAGAYRMVIDGVGNLLWGITAQTNTPANGIVTQNATGASQQLIGHANGSGSGTYYNAFFYNSSVIGSITQSGTTAVLFNVTSDQRLKENIVDAPEFGSVIDSMQVRSYDWKADGNHQRAGFIAQELVTVAPEAVHQPADPEEMMAVDYSKLVPMLVKEIQDLRKRLAAAGIA